MPLKSREERNAYARAWRASNHEKALAYQRRYQTANRDRINAQKRERRSLDPDTANARTQAWRLANPEKVIQYSRKWLAANADESKSRHLLRRFGITHSEKMEMLDRQGGSCAICGITDLPANKRWCVDHDHSTGALRGILCSTCNSGIGHLKDCPKIIGSALQYLSRHGKTLTTEEVESLTTP